MRRMFMGISKGLQALVALLFWLQGGGFCGARTKQLAQSDWSAYDGLALRVKGDGQIFKINIKTVRRA